MLIDTIFQADMYYLLFQSRKFLLDLTRQRSHGYSIMICELPQHGNIEFPEHHCMKMFLYMMLLYSNKRRSGKIFLWLKFLCIISKKANSGVTNLMLKNRSKLEARVPAELCYFGQIIIPPSFNFSFVFHKLEQKVVQWLMFHKPLRAFDNCQLWTNRIDLLWKVFYFGTSVNGGVI